MPGLSNRGPRYPGYGSEPTESQGGEMARPTKVYSYSCDRSPEPGMSPAVLVQVQQKPRPRHPPESLGPNLGCSERTALTTTISDGNLATPRTFGVRRYKISGEQLIRRDSALRWHTLIIYHLYHTQAAWAGTCMLVRSLVFNDR